jgi:hypothetical protein
MCVKNKMKGLLLKNVENLIIVPGGVDRIINSLSKGYKEGLRPRVTVGGGNNIPYSYL